MLESHWGAVIPVRLAARCGSDSGVESGSVSIFRHANMRMDSITKVRCHTKMSSLVREASAPTAEEEISDPVAADRVYTAWSTYIRVRTRDTRKYALLFQENINYGYRRNVWGLRPTGIVVTSVSFVG